MANYTKITFHSTEGVFTLPSPYSGILGPGQSAILSDDPATVAGYLGGSPPPVVTLTDEPNTLTPSPQNDPPVLPSGQVLTDPEIADGLTASGSVANDFSGSTGAFKTSSGAGTLSGSTTLAANKDLACAAGTSALDFSLGTGVFKSSTGAGTLSGSTAMAANKDLSCAAGTTALDFSLGTGVFKSPSGAGTLSGTTNIAASKNLTCSAGTTALDLSLGTGVTKTTTGLNTIGGDMLMAAAKIIGFGAPQALTGAGAANVTTLATLITSTGADAVTLANGTQAGQVKFLMMVVDGGSATITPTTATSFTNLTLTAVYDWGAVMWDGSAWRPLAFGGTAAFA